MTDEVKVKKSRMHKMAIGISKIVKMMGNSPEINRG